MIMLHGHPDCGYGWIRQIEHFSGQFRIIAPDLRGCGRSGKPGSVADYTIGNLVRDIATVIDHFGLENVTYLGHDWGGIIGWYYCAYHPERIARLATICAPHPAEYIKAISDPRQRQATQYIHSIIKTGIFNKGLETFPVRFPEPDLLTAFTTAMQETDYSAVAKYYQAAPRQSIKYPLVGIPKVRVPVLVIYPRNDPVIIEQAYANTDHWVAAPVEAVPLDLATHFPHQEQAGSVNSAISAWLSAEIEGP